jgi:hypothetical protein
MAAPEVPNDKPCIFRRITQENSQTQGVIIALLLRRSEGEYLAFTGPDGPPHWREIPELPLCG